jgi:hypothetical protein
MNGRNGTRKGKKHHHKTSITKCKKKRVSTHTHADSNTANNEQ